MKVVTLYGKPGCHLCEDARAAILAAGAELELSLEEIDVSLDPALFRDLGTRIPVVAVDGEEAFQYHVDPVELRRLLGDPPDQGRRG